MPRTAQAVQLYKLPCCQARQVVCATALPIGENKGATSTVQQGSNLQQCDPQKKEHRRPRCQRDEAPSGHTNKWVKQMPACDSEEDLHELR